MCAAKVKKISNEGLSDMFTQIINPEKADIEIIFPKYEKLRIKCKQIAKLLILIYDSPVNTVCNPEILRPLKERGDTMLQYLDKNIWDKTNLNEHWGDFKHSNTINTCIQVCAFFAKHNEQVLEDNDEWIVRSTIGHKLFDFTDIDLYLLWVGQLNEELKKYLLRTFKILYKVSLDIYNIVTSPDVDITEFSHVMIDSIAQVQKIPELSRCKHAFQRILNSVDLLKDNFGGYYKDFVISKNPTIIIENFILDVSKNQTGISPTLTREFRIIVNYYRKISSMQPSNPKLNQMFNLLDTQINKIDNSVDGKDIQPELDIQ